LGNIFVATDIIPVTQFSDNALAVHVVIEEGLA